VLINKPFSTIKENCDPKCFAKGKNDTYLLNTVNSLHFQIIYMFLNSYVVYRINLKYAFNLSKIAFCIIINIPGRKLK